MYLERFVLPLDKESDMIRQRMCYKVDRDQIAKYGIESEKKSSI